MNSSLRQMKALGYAYDSFIIFSVPSIKFTCISHIKTFIKTIPQNTFPPLVPTPISMFPKLINLCLLNEFRSQEQWNFSYVAELKRPRLITRNRGVSLTETAGIKFHSINSCLTGIKFLLPRPFCFKQHSIRSPFIIASQIAIPFSFVATATSRNFLSSCNLPPPNHSLNSETSKADGAPPRGSQ